jgi:hypothetical protein
MPLRSAVRRRAHRRALLHNGALYALVNPLNYEVSFLVVFGATMAKFRSPG